MSIAEIGDPTIFTAAFTLTSGAIAPAVVANFDGSCKVLSITRIGAPGGTAGVPATAIVLPSAAGAPACQWKLGVYSSSATDTSTYTVTWARFFQPSPSFAQGGTVAAPVTAAAGQQYAP